MERETGFYLLLVSHRGEMQGRAYTPSMPGSHDQRAVIVDDNEITALGLGSKIWIKDFDQRLVLKKTSTKELR
jgi:hypothetical protein